MRGTDSDPFYDLTIEATDSSPVLPSDVNLLVRTISLRREDAIGLSDLSTPPVATFLAMSLEAITGFLAIEATAKLWGHSQTAGFVLNLLGLVLIALLVFTVGPRVLDISPGFVPEWAIP